MIGLEADFGSRRRGAQRASIPPRAGGRRAVGRIPAGRPRRAELRAGLLGHDGAHRGRAGRVRPARHRMNAEHHDLSLNTNPCSSLRLRASRDAVWARHQLRDDLGEVGARHHPAHQRERLRAHVAVVVVERERGFEPDRLRRAVARRVKDKRDSKLDTIDEDEEKSGHK